MTPEKLAQLEATHKRIKHVVYNGTDLVFRKPTRTECQQHRAAGLSDDTSVKAGADEQLAQLTIVVCGKAEGVPAARVAFLALLEEWPYLVNEKSVGRALSQLTGVTQDDGVKTYGGTTSANAAPQTTTGAG
jgi:hypothetical protein